MESSHIYPISLIISHFHSLPVPRPGPQGPRAPGPCLWPELDEDFSAEILPRLDAIAAPFGVSTVHGPNPLRLLGFTTVNWYDCILIYILGEWVEYVYIYIYTHTHRNVCDYVCICIYIYIYIHICIEMYMIIYIYIYVNMCMYIYICIYTYT